jgi:hypothetical protein
MAELSRKALLLEKKKLLLERRKQVLLQQEPTPDKGIVNYQQLATMQTPSTYMGLTTPEPNLLNRLQLFKSGLANRLGIQPDILFPPVTGGVFTQAAERKIGGIREGVREEGLPFVGETVGEFAGSKFGPKGRIIGAGLGRAAGQGVKQFLQGLVGSPNAPKSIKEAAKRELVAFGVGAGTELTSEAIFKSLRRIGVALGFKSSPLKPYPDLDDLDVLAKRAGINFTPAERTVSRPIDTLEEISENAFFGRGKLRDIKEIAHPAGVRKAVDQMMEDILVRSDRVGRGELGEILGDVIGENNKVFKATASSLYDYVDTLTRPNIVTRDVVIDVPSAILDDAGRPYIKHIKKKVKEEVGGALTNIGRMKKLAIEIQEQRLKEGGPRIPVDDIVDNILSRPNKVNFKTAQNIRSDFLELARNAPSKKDRIVGIANNAVSIIDRQMEKAAKELSPEALKAWRTANNFYKNGKKIFTSRSVAAITKKLTTDETPDKVVDMVFRAKSPKHIKTIMGMSDDLTKKRLRYAFLDDMLTKSSGQVPGDVSDLRTLIGGRFIDSFEKFGEDALKEIFSPQELKRIRNVARIAKITQGKSGGAGGFLIQLIQAGPLAGVAGGMVTGKPSVIRKSIGAAAQISGFTWSMSHLMASPRGSKILTDIMTVPPGTAQFNALAIRLAREMAKIKREEMTKQQQQPMTLNEMRRMGP